MITFLRQLFKRQQVVRPKTVWPPRPADWTFTMSDLMDQMKAGKRGPIRQPEIEWARDYERSLIPEWVRFPRKGDVYESLADQTIDYVTAWAAPFTGGGKAVLMAGERVWVNSEPEAGRPLGAYVLPVKYKQVEQRMVPASERQSPKYGGFYFFLTTLELNQNFKLVKSRD